MDFDPELYDEFIAESIEHLTSIEECFMKLEGGDDSQKKELISSSFRAIHSIKGAAGFLGLVVISDLTHQMETLLSMMRDELIQPKELYINSLLSGCDVLSLMFEDIEERKNFDASKNIEELKNLITGNFDENIAKPPQENEEKSFYFISHIGQSEFKTEAIDLKKLEKESLFLYILKYDLSELNSKHNLTIKELNKELKSVGKIHSVDDRLNNKLKILYSSVLGIEMISAGVYLEDDEIELVLEISKIAEPVADVAEPVADVAEPIADVAEPIADVAEPIADVANITIVSDPELLEEFIEESKEHLESLEDDFLTLENSGFNKDLISKIFRAIHSIKGGAGFLGLENVGYLSHKMETILSLMRDKKLSLSPVIIDTLLSGGDILNSMLDDILNSNKIDISQILNNLTSIINGDDLSIEAKQKEEIIPSATLTQVIDRAKVKKDILFDFAEETKIQLKNLEGDILALEKSERLNIKSITKIIKEIEYTNKEASELGILNIQSLTGKINIVLNLLKEKNLKPTQYYIDKLLIAVDCLNAMIDDISNSNDYDLSNIITELNAIEIHIRNENVIIDTNQPLDEKITTTQIIKRDISKAIKKSKVLVPKVKQKEEKGKIINKDSGSIRVKVSVLEELMRLTGELVLIRNRQLLAVNEGVEAEVLNDITNNLNNVTTQLQETATKARMQAVGNIFNKFPRITRDLSKSLGKNIKLNISGEDTEIDKTVLEGLADPLTHMIRNCCDHAIETPLERTQKGKKPQGNIWLEASHNSGRINITVKDDGAGIDPEKLKIKLIEKGLKTEKEIIQMSDKEIISQIMEPGFSMATKVTDISGRGVGMDVVKSSVEKLGGNLQVSSKVGLGTTIVMSLPLTLAIIPALIVKIKDDRFAIPQICVKDLFSIYDEEMLNGIEITGNREVYRLRNRLLPMVRLKEVLERDYKFTEEVISEITAKYAEERETDKIDYQDYKNKLGDNCCATYNKSLNFVVINSSNCNYGLIIDEIIGQEEIVVKPMHSSLKEYHCYQGSTVMGDGTIALILNIEGIAKHAKVAEIIEKKELSSKNIVEDDKQEILLFKNGEKEQFALALPLIKRIEYISKEQIESVGDKNFVTIDNVTIEVIVLNKQLNVSEIVSYDNLYLIIPKHTKKNIGIVATTIIDVEEVSIDLDTEIYKEKGILGTSIINDKFTLFLDIYTIIEDNIKQSLPILDSIEQHNNLLIDAVEIKVLFVEDNKFFQKLVKGYLEAGGYDVSVANNGVEALEVFSKNEFDIVVSDLEMPIMDGFELMRVIRKINKKIPSLALTGAKSKEAIQEAKESGYTRFSIKIDKNELLHKMDSILKNSEENFQSDFEMEVK